MIKPSDALHAISKNLCNTNALKEQLYYIKHWKWKKINKLKASDKDIKHKNENEK